MLHVAICLGFVQETLFFFLQIMAISVGKNLSLFCIGIGGYPSNSVAPNIGFYTEDYSIWCPARLAMKILVLHIQFWAVGQDPWYWGRKEAGMVFVACETCVSSRVAARGLQIWLNHNQIIKTYQTLNDSPLVKPT